MAHPHDLDAWAVLGDQLQEEGDPLGHLIALDLGGGAPTDEERAAALGPAAHLLGAITWQHGVPFRASVTCAELAALGSARASRFLRELELSEADGDIAGALDEGAFDALVRLECDAFPDIDETPPTLGVAGARALAACERLGQLEHLSLGAQRIGDDGLAALARSDLARLRSLALIDNGITAVAALDELARCTALDTLNLHANRIGDRGVRALIQCGVAPRLASFILGMSGAHDGLADLAEACASLESFVLFLDTPTPASARALVTSPHASKLRALTLASCDLEDDIVEALAPSLLGRLQSLELQSNKITDRGVEVLVQAPSRLKKLNLEMNRLGEESLFALAACPQLASLEELWLWGDHDTHGVDALLESPHLSDGVKKSLAWQFGRGPEP